MSQAIDKERSVIPTLITSYQYLVMRDIKFKDYAALNIHREILNEYYTILHA